ncbi:glycogen debranching enzyme-like isoform X3 [Dinothrombium tinctorium]|uniref:Glycogen debranching enzyme n=1 Tax=Dinothrombium tinctorium TaxID=1965070 RepID=A0A443R2Z0_9ACAR|nr:glycogen debranching enzyme-like isoform X3 [Dinothrombium tinctorium]
MSNDSKMSLVLHRNQTLENRLFRVQKGCKVQFVRGSSLYGIDIEVNVNFPKDNVNFERSVYHTLETNSTSEQEVIAELIFALAGSFHYFFCTVGNKKDVLGSGYLLVEPELRVGNNLVLGLDSVQCQTVLSKCLGVFDEWKDRLKVAYKTGYNMIHFTPIQELGVSQSAYSLRDHKRLNSSFNSKTTTYTYDDVKQFVQFMEKEWKILSITDVVLNHTANESEWIHEHPDCVYNLDNSRHLRPAYLLDRVLWHTTLDIIDGKWDEQGLTIEINDEDHLSKLRDILLNHYLPKVKIYEMFLVNVEEVLKEFKPSLEAYLANKLDISTAQKSIVVIQDPEYRRYKSSVDIDSAIKYIVEKISRHDVSNQDWVQNCCNSLKAILEQKNNEITKEINYHLTSGVENVIHATRYERLQPHGPKIKFVSKVHPLVTQYFTHYGKDSDLENEESLIYDKRFSIFMMAHNGWVMNDNPLRNFAEPGSNVYLRRELIAWADSVKLRYGKKPDDCPFLWQYMKEYVEKTAEIFHGIRLDNCHSTPIELAEYLLDAARKIRPDLYLIAELFTSQEDLDNIFVNRLGITSLIRESLAAWNAHELGRYIYRFGGEPTGAFVRVDARPLTPSVAHAILFDLTHDNESPVIKRSSFDLLPTAAVVAMSYSATGSNRGYDELVPHHIHVVKESRPYAVFDESDSRPDGVSMKTGIMAAKKLFNDLHLRLGKEGYAEIFVDQVDPNTIAITRHNPITHKSVVLVARTSFSVPANPEETGYIRPIRIAGRINEVLFETKMSGNQEYEKNSGFINGLKNFTAKIKQHLQVSESDMVQVDLTLDGFNEVKFVNFTPSSVIAFDVSLDSHHINAINELRSVISCKDEIKSIVDSLTLNDLNFILFRIEQEERDEFAGGVYNIPNFTSFVYCGFVGLYFYWRDIRTKNDLGHPICDNLRNGHWLPRYIADRLKKRETTKPLGLWLEKSFNPLSLIPPTFKPRYFDIIITPVYMLLIERLWSLCSDFIQNGSNFIKLLALGSVALVGFNSSSPLPPLASSIYLKSPPVTIAAGLPHFASGYMRNWGRDTFISLRGLLLVTGRFDDACNIILGFAGCLRHGLIPNLLDRGVNARYNCRDAVWWWLQSIKDYISIVPNGEKILSLPVKRLYPKDDDDAKIDTEIIEELQVVMQEALQRHFEGINFIERNAGPKIDSQMTEKGFNIKAGVNRKTGFVFGGNEWNCGTWMDKMGSSAKAGNKGKPSSPRDGSAIELIGLSKSVVTWLGDLYKNGAYKFDGVEAQGEKWTWNHWAKLIQDNFEKYFWIDSDSRNFSENVNVKLVNRLGIYKDSFGATHEWQDYQLRPNLVIAMAVAPELFDASHAQKALSLVEEVLVGPLGMKTLDPSDWNYRGDYDNSNDSDDYKVAHGFNYHQGPEWLWPLGYYLRARLEFDENKSGAIKHINELLSNHYQHLESTPWMGLPELTNSNGKECWDSCKNQAWSAATILDVLFDIYKLPKM